MPKFSARLVLLALIPLIAVSSLALGACSNDDEANRQAAGGKVMAWQYGAGNSFGAYRGIEADFVNSYRHAKSPVSFRVAGTGKRCEGNRCDEEIKVMRRGDAVTPHNQYGKWKSYNGEVIDDSSLSWVTPDTPEGELSHFITFAIVNPVAKKPRFIIKAGTGCLRRDSDFQIALSQNESQTVDNWNFDPYCQVKLKVSRLSDSKEFIRFTIELL